MKPLQNLFSSSFLYQSSLQPFSLLFSSLSASCSATTIANATVGGSTTAADSNAVNLTQEELTKINLLIPRLCYANHFPEAICLVDATLMLNPPLKSISLSILIHSLSSQPDMIQSMSFINRLKYNPNTHPSILSINTMLISSYTGKRKLKEAFKVFNWMSRADSPCPPNKAVFSILIRGFCQRGLIFEGLKVLRAMVAANHVPSDELRIRVYRSLLKEARVKEAKDLNEALRSVDVDDEAERVKRAMEVLDFMIANWTN